MLPSLFSIIIFTFLFVTNTQFNYYMQFDDHNMDSSLYPCPKNHVYVLGLYPHTCVSYLNECLGVTEVQVKLVQDQEILCHPNYQVNLTDKVLIHNRFAVDPSRSITFEIINNTILKYTYDVQYPGCAIVLKWIDKTNSNKYYNCWYFSGTAVNGGNVIRDGENKVYGAQSEFNLKVCKNQKCRQCDTSTDNCFSCQDPEKFVDSNNQDCSLTCSKYGGLCDSQHPVAEQCRQGYYQSFETLPFVCNPCPENCKYCKDNTTCLTCGNSGDLVSYNFTNYTMAHKEKVCKGITYCVQYLQSQYQSIQCKKQSIILCKKCTDKFSNCFHCDSSQCFVCDNGYTKINNQCVKFNTCEVKCQTCLANNTSQCTTCPPTYHLINNNCVCNNFIQYFDLDGNCVHCQTGICETCISFNVCLTCKPTTFREITETMCVCQIGYYDDGDLNYVCKKCHQTCKSCEGEGPQNCLSCDSLLNRKLVKGLCICISGYGENDEQQIDPLCRKCHQKCKSCIYQNDQFSCTSCYAKQLRKISKTSECICKINYGDNNGVLDICESCFYTCDSCFGLLENQCTLCSKQSHRELSNQNKCICQKGYFENSFQTMHCLSCHYSCLDCQNNLGKNYCTQCPSSRQPTNLETTLFRCTCIDSHYFDDGFNKECQQCHYSCLSCKAFGPSFCTTCDISIRKYQNNKCDCRDRNFDDGLSTCIQCHFSCLRCTGYKSSDCIECSSQIDFRELKGGVCICQSGYFEEHSSQLCLKCSYKCTDCLEQKDFCLTCPPNSYRDLGDDYSCSCPSSYFDQADSINCQKCHKKCLSCFGLEENQCQSCKPESKRFLKQTKCICLPHYFDQNGEECSMCSQKCQECQDQFDNCTSCSSDRILVGNKCFCNTKLDGVLVSTFESSKTKCSSINYQYFECHLSCLTCIGQSSSNCLSCYDKENRQLDGSICSCIPGNFDTGQQQCSICGYQCQTCIYSENNCLSCKQNTLRSFNNVAKSCICDQGYFDDGQNPICQKCDYKCAECSKKFDSCISCGSGTHRQFNDILFTCNCVSGYYDSAESVCKPCHYSCYECFGPESSQCKSCHYMNPLSKRMFNNQVCICQNGFYDDGFSLNCQQCDPTCIQCKTEKNLCTSCSTTRFLNQNQCQCKQGYFETSLKDCSLCDENCLECKFNSRTCIQCDSLLFRVLDRTIGNCICQIGFIEINNVCQICDYSCQTCSITQDYCVSCKENRYLLNNKCLCVDGFFEIQDQCKICNKSCLTCFQNENFCLTCSIDNNRKIANSNSCQCIEGYYEQITTFSCKKCDYQCKTCINSSSNCTSCDSALNYDSYLNTCQCHSGYYLDTTSDLCQKCHISCLTCESQFNKCTSCNIQTRKFDDLHNICYCQEGYFDSNLSQCLKCHYSCKTCLMLEVNCQTCSLSYNRELLGNQCECLSGYYDVGIEICQPCGAQCKTCIDKYNKCTSCYEIEQNRNLNQNNCECQNGFYQDDSNVCKQCSMKCKNCIVSAEYCTSCDINKKRLDHSMVNKCPCVQGFYEDSFGDCQKCHIKCDGCLSTRDNCLNCKNSFKSNRYLLPNQCNCKPGFYDDNIELECQKCSKNCQTCAISATNCLMCFGNLRNDLPNCNCLDGYYEDESQNCLKCDNQCQTCINSQNNCSTCKQGRINQNCECPKGYFEGDQIDCIKCQFQCKECTQNSSKCTICRGNRINLEKCLCEEGYYDDELNDDCQKCYFSCKTCNIQGCLTCNANRVLSNEQTCNPPSNSISYQTTPWCSSCEVAVLKIRFSDDLNQILIQFEFQLKVIWQIKQCDLMLEDQTLEKLGFGYSCDIQASENQTLIIILGIQSTIFVGDQIFLKGQILQHINCQKKLQTFIFPIIQEPLNFLQPIINFDVPNFEISSCIQNLILSNNINRDGKRRFRFIKWNYAIINQEQTQVLDDFVMIINKNQEINLVIPAYTLPQNAQIGFMLSFQNFLEIKSEISFNIYTSSSKSIIAVDLRSYYFSYQQIIIPLSVSANPCNNPLTADYKINLIYTKEVDDQNLNYQIEQFDKDYAIIIPKYQLKPGFHNFNISAFETNSQQSLESQFSISIKVADLLCVTEPAINIQNYRQDLIFRILCKDLNLNQNWNEDSQIKISLNCIDVFTQSSCKSLKNESIVDSQNDFYQKVSKYSVKPYSVHQWLIQASKSNLNKEIEQMIVYLDDDFPPLKIDYNYAYAARSVGNYELLNFTYQTSFQNKSNIVEMLLGIVYDYSLISVLTISYQEIQIRLQDHIIDNFKLSNKYTLRFSVQYTTSINPNFFHLTLTLNFPPVCPQMNLNEAVYFGLTQLEISIYCQNEEDSPYYYKFGYFLSEEDLKSYLTGDLILILGEQTYQKSPKFKSIIPNSFKEKPIIYLLSIMDQGGSITHLFRKTVVNNSFNCSIYKDLDITELSLLLQIAQMIQALGQEGQDCVILAKQYFLTFNRMNVFQNKEFSSLLRVIKIYKQFQLSNYQKLLEEKESNICFNKSNDAFYSYSTLNGNEQKLNQTNTIAEILQSFSKFQLLISYLTQNLMSQNQLYRNQTYEQDQILFEKYKSAQGLIPLSINLADGILIQLSQQTQIDEQIFNTTINLLSEINQFTDLIFELVAVNGNSTTVEGNIIQWRMSRISRASVAKELNQSEVFEDNLVKFVLKQQISLQFNPFLLDNKTINQIQKNYKNSTIKFDQTKMVIAQIKNFLQNGKTIVQWETQGYYQVKMNEIMFCSNSQNSQHKNYSPKCILISESNKIYNCESKIISQEENASIYCSCSRFGQIFIIFFEEEKPNSTYNITDEETIEIQQMSLLNFSLQIKLPILISVIVYIIIVYGIYFWLLFQQKKTQTQNIGKLQIQANKKTTLQCYPGNISILKKHFIYLHQITQFFCNSEIMVSKSFQFIDLNFQVCFMLSMLYLINVNKVEQINFLQILFVCLAGMIFRLFSKIFQGFLRLNRTWNIIVNLLFLFTFLQFVLLIMIVSSSQNAQQNLQKLKNFTIGFIFHEVICETFLCIESVLIYKAVFQSIRIQEFKKTYHLFYYFAYHERLEEDFKQYVII